MWLPNSFVQEGLRVAKEEQAKYIKQQDKQIEHLEEQLKFLAYAPLAFRYPYKLSVLNKLSHLQSFVSNNENQQVFDNLVNFMIAKCTSDYQVTRKCLE